MAVDNPKESRQPYFLYTKNKALCFLSGQSVYMILQMPHLMASPCRIIGVQKSHLII